jgi:hypothetical protein
MSTSGVGSSYGVNLQMLNTTQIGVFSLLLFSGSIIETNSGNSSLVASSKSDKQNDISMLKSLLINKKIPVANNSEMNQDVVVNILVDDFIQLCINRSTLSLIYSAREKLLQSLILYIDNSSSFQSLSLAKDIDIIIQALNFEQQNFKISNDYTTNDSNNSNSSQYNKRSNNVNKSTSGRRGNK